MNTMFGFFAELAAQATPEQKPTTNSRVSRYLMVFSLEQSGLAEVLFRVALGLHPLVQFRPHLLQPRRVLLLTGEVLLLVRIGLQVVQLLVGALAVSLHHGGSRGRGFRRLHPRLPVWHAVAVGHWAAVDVRGVLVLGV